MRLSSYCGLLVALFIALPAFAAPQRLRVEAMEYPWSAMGRLNMAGRAYCSAVLIGERHILTAAHCLWNAARQDWWPAGSIHFIAGYQGGEALLVSLVKNYVIADHYRGEPPADLTHADTDWAIAELEEPLGKNAGWIASDARPGHADLLGHLGYRAESRFAMSLDYGCKILGTIDQNRLLWDDCEAAHGDSGGPLLSFQADGPHVLGITIEVRKSAGGTQTGSVALSNFSDVTHFPLAARAALAAGLGRPGGHAPDAGSPASALPVKTMAALGDEGRPATMAALKKRLADKAAP
jgi:V8-like Glu-specific endopeptidase